jgi:hypothetical protein
MSTEQSAFISALTKFCHLQLEEAEEKHLLAIHTLIEIALEDGNYLRGCWEKVTLKIFFRNAPKIVRQTVL